MPYNRSVRNGLASFNMTPLLDLFMLAVLVFAMNITNVAKDAEATARQSAKQEIDQMRTANSNLVSRISAQQTRIEKLTIQVDAFCSESNRVSSITERFWQLQATYSNVVSQAERFKNELTFTNGRFNDCTNELLHAKKQNSQLSNALNIATNELANLTNQLEKLKDAKEQYDKLVQNLSGGTNENIVVTICEAPKASHQLFWQNNREWSVCSDGGLDDFKKKKSMPDDVRVLVNYVRFEDCPDVEASDTIKRLDLLWPGNVVKQNSMCCHRIYFSQAGDIFFDYDEESVRFSDLRERISFCFGGDGVMPNCPAKFYVIGTEESKINSVEKDIRDIYAGKISVSVVKIRY